MPWRPLFDLNDVIYNFTRPKVGFFHEAIVNDRGRFRLVRLNDEIEAMVVQGVNGRRDRPRTNAQQGGAAMKALLR